MCPKVRSHRFPRRIPVSAAPDQVPPGQINDLARRQGHDFRQGRDRRRNRRGHRSGPGQGGPDIMVDGKEWDLFRPIEHDAHIRIITKKDRQVAGADPPRHGPCSGHGGAGALSRHPGHHRPGHRRRLLLRLRPRRALHARRPAQNRRARCARSSRQALPTRREVWPRDKAIAAFQGTSAKPTRPN